MLVASKDALSTASPFDTSNSMVEHESVEEDDWVIVKKQRITILVPPASPVHHQTRSPMSNCMRTNSRKKVRSSSHTLKKRWPKHLKGEHKQPPVSTSEHETQVDVVPRLTAKATDIHPILDAPVDTEADILPTPTIKNREDSDHFVGDSLLQLVPLGHFVGDGNIMVCSKTRKFRSSKTFGSVPRARIGALNVVNHQMRASNLERKLIRLGGLRKWLVSKGLSRFIEVFEREKLGKFQLVNLTMSKLKDMGTDAVGPRRKLIHAIDSLCQPYYFKAFQ